MGKAKNLMETHPEIASEWDYEANGDLQPSMVHKNQRTKVMWHCECKSYPHSYELAINQKVQGVGCAYCRGLKILVGYNDLITTMPELAKERNYKLNDNISPAQFTKGSQKLYIGNI